MKKILVIFVNLFLILMLSPIVMAQTPAEATVSIKGQLVNATSGETAPAGIPLMLHSYDGRQMNGMIDGETGPKGTFHFEGVQTTEGRLFEVMATVGQTTYFSEMAAVSPGQTILELPVTIYDTTTDAGAIYIEQMHTLVDFFSPTVLQIVEIYIISNDGNQTVEGATTLEDGQAATLRFTLPEGAVNLSFEQGKLGERFIQTGDGFADTFGVRPGSETSQFMVKYYLPYQDGMGINRMASYPTSRLGVIMSQMEVSLTSDDLASEGSRQMQDGRTVDIFTAEGIQAGQSFSFELNGQPVLASAGESPELLAQPTPQPKIAQTSVVIGWGVIVLGSAVLIAGGIWWWRQRTVIPDSVSNSGQSPGIEPEKPEVALIRAIAELDKAHQEDALSDESYASRRRDLRDELVAVLIQQGKIDSDNQEVETEIEPDMERS